MDKSPAGCNTVQEYLYDDLASDSEDDKKLNAAEARALRKQKFKEKKNLFFFFSTNQPTRRNKAQPPKFSSPQVR